MSSRGGCRASGSAIGSSVSSSSATFPIKVERLRLPAASVERAHELRARTFAKWMLVDERLELPDELTVPAQRKVVLNAQLERRRAELFEAKDLRLRERLVREVGESRSAPKAERIAQQSRSLVGRCPSRLFDELFETGGDAGNVRFISVGCCRGNTTCSSDSASSATRLPCGFAWGHGGLLSYQVDVAVAGDGSKAVVWALNNPRPSDWSFGDRRYCA
jgi:hypothetical protein